MALVIPLEALAVAALCGLFALYVVARNPRSFDSLSFGAGLLSLAAIVAGEVLSESRLGGSPDWHRLTLSGEALFPAAWLAFAAHFGQKEEHKGFRLSYLAGAAAVCFTVVAAIRPVHLSFFAEREAALLYVTRGGYYFYLASVLVAVLALVRLESLLWFTRGGTRWTVKYAVIGAGGLLGVFIYYYSFPVLYGVLDTALLPVRNAVFLVSLLLLTGAFLRQGFLGANVFVSRRIVFPSAALLAVGLYFIVLGLIGEGVRHLDENISRNVVVFLAFFGGIVFVILFLSESFRRRAKRFITDNFYRHRYEYKDEWLKFTGRLSSAETTDDVVTAILDIMSETFGVDHVCYWRPADDGSLHHERCNRSIPVGTGVMEPGEGVMRRLREGSILDRRGDGSAALGLEDEAWRFVRAEVLIPLRTPDGTLSGVVVLGRNLGGFAYDDEDYELMRTLARQGAYAIEKNRLAAQLAEAREMEAMGKLTAFVLHDLKNMTTSLSMVLRNAEQFLDRPEFQQDMIRTIRNTVDRMTAVTGKLTDLRQEGQPRFSIIALGALTDDIPAGMAIPERIAFQAPANHADLKVRADREQIRKVLVNLLLNAVQSIDGAGRVTMDFLAEKGFGCVKISDTGCGIDPEFMRTGLFRPFRTTKPAGLGIGLYHCRSIVAGHGGRLEIESTPGQGTSATLWLPLAEGAPEDRDTRAPAGGVPPTHGG